MRVDNYTITLQSQHYSLELGARETKIETAEEQFDKNKASITPLEATKNIKSQNENELSIALSKAILENIQNKSPLSIRDTINMDYTYTQAEGLNFKVQATIQTDSKEIELSLDISLSKSFVQKTHISFERMQELKDPLVISFDGTFPRLSSTTFTFDIDSDGSKDQISQLAGNSAFLAIDSNNNGIIDNGNELFGTQSGNGFTDLKLYDEDNNGWIDENDAIFEKLRVWKKTDGKDELLALGEVGIGAIFLGNTDTPFAIRSENNSTLGEIRSSGFFVYENGKAGVVSQIDFALTPETKETLENVKDLQKDINSVGIISAYKDKNTDQESSPVEKLQDKLRILEKKLFKAQDEEKRTIQAQIMAINSQIMALLTQEFI